LTPETFRVSSCPGREHAEPLEKAVDLVRRLTMMEGPEVTGQTCRVALTLQTPIPSCGELGDMEPWRT